MAKIGRPLKEISKVEFEKLCEFQATLEEIAGWFRVSEDTVERWTLREYNEGFADISRKKRGKGKLSLRRKQYQEAMKGNTALLIWLGKQYLEQSDKQELDLKKPMVIKIDGDDKEL